MNKVKRSTKKQLHLFANQMKTLKLSPHKGKQMEKLLKDFILHHPTPFFPILKMIKNNNLKIPDELPIEWKNGLNKEKSLPDHFPGENIFSADWQSYYNPSCLGCCSKILSQLQYDTWTFLHPFICLSNYEKGSILQKLDQAVIGLLNQPKEGFVMIGGELTNSGETMRFKGISFSQNQMDDVQERIKEYFQTQCLKKQQVYSTMQTSFIQCVQSQKDEGEKGNKKYIIRIRVTPPCDGRVYYRQTASKETEVLLSRLNMSVKIEGKQLYNWMIARNKNQNLKKSGSELRKIHYGLHCSTDTSRIFKSHQYQQNSLVYCQPSFYQSFIQKLSEEGIKFKQLDWASLQVCKKKKFYFIAHDNDIFSPFYATLKEAEEVKKNLKYKPFIDRVQSKIFVPFRKQNAKKVENAVNSLINQREKTFFMNKTESETDGWRLYFQTEEGASYAYQLLKNQEIEDGRFCN